MSTKLLIATLVQTYRDDTDIIAEQETTCVDMHLLAHVNGNDRERTERDEDGQ